MRKNTLNKVSSSSSAAACTGLTPAGTSTNCSHSVLWGTPAYEHFWFHVGRCFLPLFMFHQCFARLVLVGNQQWPPAKLLIKSRGSWWDCPLHQATLTDVWPHVKQRSWGVAVTCGQDAALLSNREFGKMNLMLNIMFVPNFTLFTDVSIRKPVLFYFMYLFCVV